MFFFTKKAIKRGIRIEFINRTKTALRPKLFWYYVLVEHLSNLVNVLKITK